jgi:hypothetical protein
MENQGTTQEWVEIFMLKASYYEMKHGDRNCEMKLSVLFDANALKFGTNP